MLVVPGQRRKGHEGPIWWVTARASHTKTRSRPSPGGSCHEQTLPRDRIDIIVRRMEATHSLYSIGLKKPLNFVVSS